MDDFSDIEKLRFYRDEVKHEFNLLATRTTILVTCQSFLVVPFAILNTVGEFDAAVPSIFWVAALGVFVAALLINPIQAGRRTLDKWLLKQRRLMREHPELQALAIDRDLIRDAESDPAKDVDHIKSLAFADYGPWTFIVFWIGAVACAAYRAWG